MTERTSAYRFTIQLQNGKPVSEQEHLLTALRQTIKAENIWRKQKQYVKLQGRGCRRGIPQWNQSLPLVHATHADVYVYTRN